jgi:hypothetical protein
MSTSVRVACICLAALALLGSLPARADSILPQWQPQFSQQGLDPDPRLEHAVVLAPPGSDLATVIAELAKQSGVALACENELRLRRITIYLPGTRLKDVMAELAPFVMCEWWKEGSPPRYTLRKTNSLRQAEEKLLVPPADLQPPTQPWANVDAAMQRLQEYAAALPLSEDELIRQYQDSDPWVAATLLNPLERGFIPFLTGLSRDQVDLACRGQLKFRVSDLPTGVRQQVERWVSGGYLHTLPSLVDTDGRDWRQPDPSYLIRFNTWEERWQHAVIWVTWGPQGMSVNLMIPDIASIISCHPIWTDDKTNLRGALGRIFSHQHPEPTAEERAAFEARMVAVDKASSELTEQYWRDRRLSDLRQSGADWSDGEALARKCVVWPFPRAGSGWIGADELVVRVAAGTGLPLLAGTSPSRFGDGLVPEELTHEQTLRGALEILGQGGGVIWSKPQGRFLRVNGPALALGDIPPQVFAQWDEAMRGQRRMTFEQYMALASGLTPAQRRYGLQRTRWAAAAGEFNGMFESLRGSVGRRLLAGEEVPIQDLGERERRAAFNRASYWRPWITENDVSRTTLTLMRRPTGSWGPGVPTIDVVYNYHFPDAPTDRDLAASCPTSVALRPPPEPIKVTHPFPPFPETASSPQAVLGQTNWMFRGNVTIDGKRSAMLSNDSTGEMELVEVGGAFRGLTVTEIRDSGVTFTDPAGGTAVLTFHARAPSEPQL